MSYQEALADGIPMRKTSRGFNSYLPPCAVCGIAVHSWSYIPGTRYLCYGCRQKQKPGKHTFSDESVHENA